MESSEPVSTMEAVPCAERALHQTEIELSRGWAVPMGISPGLRGRSARPAAVLTRPSAGGEPSRRCWMCSTDIGHEVSTGRFVVFGRHDALTHCDRGRGP
jgi:hypothetical protein